MILNNLNNLLELFFIQFKTEKDKKKILLSSLKEPRTDYSWEKTFNSIIKLSEEIKKYTNKGDRCLLISENRPEWFISDLAIMLSGSITVPAYTTI
jgi:Long-chain acyl-CoA synthetases (AMP-forming)